ncbi:hypothetical protein GGR54DRAFT_629122 [Hypoxylon sp. NC1633]|nr:hypothetical protein GGR54DRAFT_629122 [Hypoxylon sp. NC1633]
MLPDAVPSARIYTYGWDAKVFDEAPVQTLLGHADNLLSLVAAEHGTSGRPIIFIASCFGGLVLAEAICRAAQEGSRYRQILRSTVGTVFLATPFLGTDAAREASWLVVVKGIMGKDASGQLIKDLEKRHAFVRERVQKFAEIANNDAIRLPISCFYETKKTKIAGKILPTWIAKGSRGSLLVHESSACLQGFDRHSLGKTHVMMNKFEGKDCHDFILVKQAIQDMLKEAPSTLKLREREAKNSHFLVPFGRNENFVGRESILQQLLEQIAPSTNKDNCQRTAIEGLGGIGKTQIALEAAYQVRDKHLDCSVFWVPAVNATNFEAAYRRIGEALGIPGLSNDKADIKTLVKAALSDEGAGSWLLIIDNADDLELIPLLSKALPFNPKGSILFTTRTRAVVSKLGISPQGSIRTTEMSGEESLEMLKKYVKNESHLNDTASTTALLDLLANLPLAIRQASAYMFENGTSTTQYLSYCRSSNDHMVELLSEDFQDRGRYETSKNPVAMTWLISFEHIRQSRPLAAQYLKFICLLAEKDIPVSLLPPGRNQRETDEAIGTLKGYAFITERNQADSFDIHRLVQLVMRNWLRKNGEWKEWAMSVTEQLADKYPSPKHENRSIWMRLMAHGQVVSELQEQGGVEEAMVSLRCKVAKTYGLLGKYNDAERLYRHILQILGKEHPDTLDSMNNLAVTLNDQGKYEEAEQIHRQTLELWKQVLGREHPYTLSSMNNLANTLHNQGKYEEAEPIYYQTLELWKQVLGREHPDTLKSMNNLAVTLDNQGKYEEAEQIYRQTLELRKQVLGREHPDTLSSMNNLASNLDHQGKYEEAELIHRQTLELWKQVLGREHPDTLKSMNNLASNLDHQGKYEEAELIHRQTLELWKQVLGREHPDTLKSMNNLAVTLDDQGKYEEAEQIYRQTLELWKQVLGREHPDILDSMNNLANTLVHQGKYEEAEQIYRQTIELKERVLGKEHPSTLGTKRNLDAYLEYLKAMLL